MKYTRSFTFLILAFNIILAQFPSMNDYSNRNRSLDHLSRSGAEVKVYTKGRMMNHFKVPQNKKGSTWYVFRVANSKIIAINKIRS